MNKWLATLSRNTCSDLGQLIGTYDEVMKLIQDKAGRAQKPFQVNLLEFDKENRFTGTREEWVASPGGELQKQGDWLAQKVNKLTKAATIN